MFYDQLKKICDSRNIKMTPLIVECGGSKSNVTTWKNGASPNVDIVMKIAKKLNVSLDYLLTGDDFPKTAHSADFFRVLLSDEGVRAIKRQIAAVIKLNNEKSNDIFDELSDIGCSFGDIKQFITGETGLGDSVLSKLDAVLLILDTNIYSLIKNDVEFQYSDFLKLYSKLDLEDKAEIRGEIKGILRQEKYKNNTTSIINDISQEMAPSFKKAVVED